MMDRRSFLKQSVRVTLGTAASLAPVWSQASFSQRAKTTPAHGPLCVHPANGRYFTDGSGRAIYFAGSHLGWELQDNAWDTAYSFDYAAYLNLLQSEHHNFIRLWVVEHTRSAKAADPDAVASPMP